MYHSFLIHLSVDGHLGCFHVLAIVNSAVVNIVGTCVSFNSGFLGVCAQQWDCWVVLACLTFNFLRYPSLLLSSSLPFYFSRKTMTSKWRDIRVFAGCVIVSIANLLFWCSPMQIPNGHFNVILESDKNVFHMNLIKVSRGPVVWAGEGNGNPLQCSRLDDPRDGRAWWAAVYGVSQSQTRLKRLSSSSSSGLQDQG